MTMDDWIKGIGDVYCESFDGTGMALPPRRGGTIPPNETRNGLAYRDITKPGGGVNLLDRSINSGQNPFPNEQEEEKLIPKSKVISLMREEMKGSNDQMEQYVTMVLNRIIKKL